MQATNLSQRLKSYKTEVVNIQQIRRRDQCWNSWNKDFLRMCKTVKNISFFSVNNVLQPPQGIYFNM